MAHAFGDGRCELNQTMEEKNKALVLEAFDTRFNKRDYVAAKRDSSPNRDDIQAMVDYFDVDEGRKP